MILRFSGYGFSLSIIKILIMQPKFTQKIIVSFRVKIFTLALILVSLTRVSYSQGLELFNEGFNTVVPGGWSTQNNSNPLGTQTWFQGNPNVMVANSGDPTSYAGVNFQSGSGVATISNWLIAPTVSL